MSKGIISYPPEKRAQVVARRLKNKTGGLGYLAALDYQAKYRGNLALADNIVSK